MKHMGEEHRRFIAVSVEWAKLHTKARETTDHIEHDKATSRMREIDREQEQMLKKAEDENKL